MDPEAFAQAFYAWGKTRDLNEEQVCIYGKSLRAALGKNGKSNLHIVHAYAHKQGFKYVQNCDFYESVEKKSERIDKRSVAIISDPSEIELSNDWPSVETFIEVTRETTYKKKTSTERRYYISDRIGSAEEFGKKIRAHWGVESFHWVLDVVFKEDNCAANTLYAGENLGTLRRAAINLVQSNPHLKKKGFAKVRKQSKWGSDVVMKKICEALFGVKSF